MSNSDVVAGTAVDFDEIKGRIAQGGGRALTGDTMKVSMEGLQGLVPDIPIQADEEGQEEGEEDADGSNSAASGGTPRKGDKAGAADSWWNRDKCVGARLSHIKCNMYAWNALVTSMINLFNACHMGFLCGAGRAGI